MKLKIIDSAMEEHARLVSQKGLYPKDEYEARMKELGDITSRVAGIINIH